MIGIVILNYQNWEDTFCCVQSIWDNPPNESFQFIPSSYGYELKVSFYSFIRPEQRFSSVEMLKEQMERDIETSRSRMMSINGDM